MISLPTPTSQMYFTLNRLSRLPLPVDRSCLKAAVMAVMLAIYSSFASMLSAATNPSPDVSVLLPAADGAENAIGAWATVDEGTPSITLNFYRDGDFAVYRRLYGETVWGSPIAASTGGVFSWTDTNVSVGEVYEYGFKDNASNVYGYIVASIRADRDLDRGIVILVIADTVITGNESRIHRLIEDLVGDGWRVKLLHTPSHFDAAWDFDTYGTDGFYGYDSVRILRRQIQKIHDEHPGEVKILYNLGHVPTLQTGTRVGHTDGHGNRSGYVTDFVYGDTDGRYTDVANSDPNSSIDGETDAPRTVSSVPWDGIYDQNNMASRLELGVGRVDPVNIPGATDAEHVGVYLDKAHNYRHLKAYGLAGSEQVLGTKAGYRHNPAGQSGAVATSVQLLSIFGPERMEPYALISGLPSAVAPNTDETVQHIIDTGPYMYFAQNTEKPPTVDIGSTAAHRLSMQSNWGDWYNQLESRKDIFRDTNMTLSWLYTGRWAPQFLNFPLGIGEPYGEVLKLSANYEHDEYFTAFPFGHGTTVREFIHTFVGDPTLRLFPVEPVSNLLATPVVGSVQLNWSAPSDLSGFEAYRVYRSDDLMGDFTLLASDLSATSFTDNAPLAGSNVYMVKAVHLVENGSGTFLNNSQGRFVTVGLRIDTTVLPPFPIGEDVNVNFQSSGGSGTVSWSVVSGHLPPGMSLAADGSLSGNPVSPGSFVFILEAADSASTIQREYVAFVDSAETLIMDVDLRESNGGGLADKSYYQRQLTVHGDPQWDTEGGMRFDGVDDAVQVHDLATTTFPDFTLFPSAKSNSNGFAIMAAFKADASSQGGTLVSKATNFDTFWQDNLSQYAITITPAGKVQSWVSWGRITSSQSYNDGLWHTVAYVRKIPGSTELYIDGVLVGSLAHPGIWIVPEDFLIGARWNGDEASGVTDVFDGSISDVRVFKTGITAGEVKAWHERVTQSRPDITPSAPVLSGLPSQVSVEDSSVNFEFSLPFSVTDDNGEPVNIALMPEDSTLFAYLDVMATQDGFLLKGELLADSIGDHRLDILADDGWPGMVNRHSITFSVGGLENDSFNLPVDGGLMDVLANDVAVSGSSFSLNAVVQQPSMGYVRIEGDQLRFYPPPMWNQAVAFTYEVQTSTGALLEAQVSVSPERLPVPIGDAYVYSGTGTLLMDVLANDLASDLPSSVPGELVTLVSVQQPERGSVKIVGDQLEYQPATGDSNFLDAFTYSIVNEDGFYGSTSVNVLSEHLTVSPAQLELLMDTGSGTDLTNSGELTLAGTPQIHGAAAWEARGGGSALVFDGTSTYVDLGTALPEINVDPAAGSFSIAMAIKPDNYADFDAASQVLLSKETGTGSGDQFSLLLGPRFPGFNYLGYSKIHTMFPATASTAFPSSNIHISPSQWGALDPNTTSPVWHQLVVTYDASTHLLKYYVDNWLASQVLIDPVNSIPENGVNWILGARRDGAGGFKDFFSGSIDNVRFYDRSISALEVKALIQDLGLANTNMAPSYLVHEGIPDSSSLFEVGKTYNLTLPVEDVDGGYSFEYLRLHDTFGNTVDLPGINFEFTPAVTGLYRVSFRLNPNDGSASNLTFNLSRYFYVQATETIDWPFQLDGHQQLPAIRVGENLNISLLATHGTTPYSFTSDNLPPGISLDPVTGALSGSVAATGNYVFSVTAMDSDSTSSDREYKLQVLPADTDNDGIEDDWETLYLGSLSDDGSGDDDGDGRATLVEFAAVSHPDQFDAGNLLTVKVTHGIPVSGNDRYIEIQYPRRSRLPVSVQFSIQVSHDLVNWVEVSGTQYVLSDDGEKQVIKLRSPMGAEKTKFYRIRVQK